MFSTASLCFVIMCLAGVTFGIRKPERHQLLELVEQAPLEDVIYEDFVATLPNLSRLGCVAITGTTSGTGFWAASAAARLRVPCLLLLNRESKRSVNAQAKIEALAATNVTVKTVHLDLKSLAAVPRAASAATRIAAEFGGISVLVLNAGISLGADARTGDGFDSTMQVNHISHFLLTKLLMPSLEAAAAAHGEARIVTHSSMTRWMSMPSIVNVGHGMISSPLVRQHFLRSEPGTLGGDTMAARWERYHQSKLAVAVFAMALHTKLPQAIKALSAAPGVASTGMAEAAMQSAADGSCPLLAAMFAPDANSGDMYEPEGFSGGWLPGPSLSGWPIKVIKAGVPEWEIKDGLTCGEESRRHLWSWTEEALGEFFTL
jgi:NAD(P)-dependent dehydrogenase (short-subunit alcohol dehydrogenase family)